MLDSLKGFVDDFFGKGNQDYDEDDGRKRDYGELSELRDRRKRRRAVAAKERNRMLRMKRGDPGVADEIYSRSRGSRVQHRSLEGGVHKPRNSDSASASSAANNYNGGTRRRQYREVSPEFVTGVPPRNNGRLRTLVNSIKSVFSNDTQELNMMQRASENLNVLVPVSPALSEREERMLIQDRIIRSEVFRKKLMEKRHDDVLLEQLKRGRSKTVDTPGYVSSSNLNITNDQVTLLQKKIDDMEEKITSLTKELQISKKKLKFAKEKNLLLQSLLDDANIDSEYVKSRRDIKNLQKENLIPETDLPPSPKRTVNPLFTSSPMRKPTIEANEDDDMNTGDIGPDEFYSKYPKIPETETLTQHGKEKSLSPIRIDYSKYSSPR
ncbi:hypothetical protein Kpol_1013p41 [Vanderwaltozyma polyspora DSM 70294]|uniref:Uncharacterized protein n=1 Tax=Vanderwaltozyma polyspora (strain ATCC 22028 / DSM 70294 / BCRC 21397 / CBS 2163 / NBRC 10782 / NRRL Y-8283 / UCD 57-17) TaxID=436907 RepID=A7TH88_VANPO|nr:uncharacterized protein Kpol_1013p41 [Vanderwaltozyma polyspora DSM 70294]EDO18369.1 hypothetical protein Kpol_1013p41 [Vanderwaltozyma polyspora DSM 70294]